MSPARPTFGHMAIRLDLQLKERLKKKAKANGRSLNAEAVYRLDVEGRLRADLAAGLTPVIAEPAAPVIAPVAEPAAAPAPDVSAAPQEAWELLHDLRDACLEPDTDTCIPSSLGRRLQAITAMFPRARA